jgi:hypothetical protein
VADVSAGAGSDFATDFVVVRLDGPLGGTDFDRPPDVPDAAAAEAKATVTELPLALML